MPVLSTEEVGVGETVSVRVEVTNVGGRRGTHRVELRQGTVVVGAETVELEGGGSSTVVFEYTPQAVGSYRLQVADQSVTVIVLAPAQLQVNRLVVEPSVVLPLGEATVTVDVHNIGEVTRPLPVVLRVDGVENDAQRITLRPGEAGTVSFPLRRDTPGTYEVAVGDALQRMTVIPLTTYESALFGYSVSYPEQWLLFEPDPRTVTLAQPGLGVMEIDTLVTPGFSVEQTFDLWVESVRRSLWEDFPDPRRRPIIDGEHLIGYSFEASLTTPEGDLRIVGEMTRGGRWAWVRWMTLSEEAYPFNRSLIASVLGSFEPPHTATGTYADPSEGYGLSLPVGWDGWGAGGGTQLFQVVSGPGGDLVSGGVYLVRVLGKEDLAERALATITTFYGAAPDFQVVAERAVSVPQADEGYEVEATFSAGDQTIRARQRSIRRGSQQFLIDVASDAVAFESHAQDIDAFVEGFTLTAIEPFGASREDSLFLVEGPISTLDPALFRGGADGIPSALFSGLVALDTDLRVVPDLAEDWEVSEDGTVYTFTLRAGLRFHDGRPVTAEDVRFSWERAADPELASPKARTFLGDIVGVVDVLEGRATTIDGLEVVDERTLRVTIEAARVHFLQKLTYPTAAVVDRRNVLSGPTWTERANGTGPFRLRAWVPGSLLVLERSAYYDRGQVGPAHIVYRLNGGSPLLMYEAGEIDVAELEFGEAVDFLDPRHSHHDELAVVPQLCTGYLAMNPSLPPFDDIKVRQAFALSLDIDQWLRDSFLDIDSRASSILPPALPGYGGDVLTATANVERAHALIAESSYGSVASLPAVVTYGANEELLGMLEHGLGIEVDQRLPASLEEYYELHDQRQVPLSTSGWCADYPDPQNFLELLFRSDSTENHFGYASQAVDHALAVAAVEPDPVVRLSLYQEIERQVLADWVVVPLRHFTKYVLIRPEIEGYVVPPMGVHVLKQVEVRRR